MSDKTETLGAEATMAPKAEPANNQTAPGQPSGEAATESPRLPAYVMHS